MVQPEAKVTLIHSRQQLLSSEDLPDEFKEKTLEMLKESGVEVVMGARVQDTVRGDESAPAKYTLKLSDGRELAADHVINACHGSHQHPHIFLRKPVMPRDMSVSRPVFNFPQMFRTRNITTLLVILSPGLVLSVVVRRCTRRILQFSTSTSRCWQSGTIRNPSLSSWLT